MNDETKEAQEALATLQFSREEIQLITGTTEVDETAFLRGQLMAQAEVRKSILSMAKQGSSPAQKQFLELVNGDTRTKKEIDAMIKWAKSGIPDDYKSGVSDALAWVFSRGKSPKELY